MGKDNKSEKVIPKFTVAGKYQSQNALVYHWAERTIEIILILIGDFRPRPN